MGRTTDAASWRGLAGIGRTTDATFWKVRTGEKGRQLDQAAAHSKGHGSCPVLAVRLVEDVREVCGDRFLA
jgi:hypothetical protein